MIEVTAKNIQVEEKDILYNTVSFDVYIDDVRQPEPRIFFPKKAETQTTINNIIKNLLDGIANTHEQSRAKPNRDTAAMRKEFLNKEVKVMRA